MQPRSAFAIAFGCLITASAAPSRADLWISDASGYGLNRFSDDGTFIRAEFAGGEGIYDMARSPDDRTLWATSNALGFAVTVLTDVASESSTFVSLDRYRGQIPRADAPVAGDRNGVAYVGFNGAFVPPTTPDPTTFPPYSILQIDPDGTDARVFTGPAVGQTAGYDDLAVGRADGALYVHRTDNRLLRYSTDINNVVHTTSIDGVTRFSQLANGEIAGLGTDGRLMAYAASDAGFAQDRVLLTAAQISGLIGSTTITSMIVGVNDRLYFDSYDPPVVDRPASGSKVTWIDPASGASGRLAQPPAAYGTLGRVMEYTAVPEPGSLALVAAAAALAGVRRRDR